MVDVERSNWESPDNPVFMHSTRWPEDAQFNRAVIQGELRALLAKAYALLGEIDLANAAVDAEENPIKKEELRKTVSFFINVYRNRLEKNVSVEAKKQIAEDEEKKSDAGESPSEPDTPPEPQTTPWKIPLLIGITATAGVVMAWRCFRKKG